MILRMLITWILAPGRRQAIILANVGMLFIRPLGTNLRKIENEIIHFHSRKCIWTCRQEIDGHLVSASMC